jgi:hypothetical protein
MDDGFISDILYCVVQFSRPLNFRKVAKQKHSAPTTIGVLGSPGRQGGEYVANVGRITPNSV